MKKFIAAGILFASLSFAGPLEVATYPVRHPVKTAKGIGKAFKKVLW